jgi:hypothetical protein
VSFKPATRPNSTRQSCVLLTSITRGEHDWPEAARRRRDRYGELKSFRVVAASALLAELDLFKKGKKGGGA